MKRFTLETDAQLAVSLHATTESSRASIVPANNKHSLQEILLTLEDLYPKGKTKGRHGRHVLIEYVMLQDVNDAAEDAKRLAEILSKIECKINLLAFNTFDGAQVVASGRDRIGAFREILVRQGYVCTVRDSRGDDEMAACGQLGLGKK